MEPKLSKEEFGNRLKGTMTRKNITQKKLSELVDTSEANISNYARGKAFPPVDILAKIASVLDVSIDWLCNVETDQGGSLRKETFGDAARILVSLSNNGYIKVETISATETICRQGADYYDVEYEDVAVEKTIITFPRSEFVHENPIERFAADWLTMHKLRDAKTIDQSLYERWLYDRFNSLDEEYIDLLDQMGPLLWE